MPTYLRWCEKMWVLSACLASMWHGKCYLERKYLILYYYQDDNCNRIIHGRVFVQDPTLFTGLFTTQSQKSEYPPPPLLIQQWQQLMWQWVKDVQGDGSSWQLALVGMSTQSLPILFTDCTPQDTLPTPRSGLWPWKCSFDPHHLPPPPPPHIHTHPSHPLNHIFSSTTRLSLESFTWAVWWWPSANASYHQQQAHNKW